MGINYSMSLANLINMEYMVELYWKIEQVVCALKHVFVMFINLGHFVSLVCATCVAFLGFGSAYNWIVCSFKYLHLVSCPMWMIGQIYICILGMILYIWGFFCCIVRTYTIQLHMIGVMMVVYMSPLVGTLPLNCSS